MSRRTQFTLLAVAYALVLGAPFLLRPAAESWEAETKLQIISPHWEGIQYEFQRGFREWYLAETGRRVDVEWLIIGGTSDIMRQLESEYKTYPEGGRIDLIYGGGMDFFLRLQSKGFLQPWKLPEELHNAIPETCAGVPLFDPEFHWYGAALSGFGIIYNKAVLKDRGVVFPTTWEDLGRPELFSWVGAGDPGKSGSVHMMFEIVLQALGWEKGMDLIARMGANARYFSEGGSDVPQDVAFGEVAMGMCIDFYAWSKIVEVGADRVGFAMPEGMTVINPDPIGILKGAPQQELAQAFVRYVMSRPGQQLWMYRKGIEGGPRKFALTRFSALPELYRDSAEKLVIDSNPFLMRGGLKYDGKKGGTRWQVLNDFIRAAVIDTHEDAVVAWESLRRRGFPKVEVREFGESPIDEEAFMSFTTKWKDAEFREKTRTEWVHWFRSKYQEIAAGL